MHGLYATSSFATGSLVSPEILCIFASECLVSNGSESYRSVTGKGATAQCRKSKAKKHAFLRLKSYYVKQMNIRRQYGNS